MGSNNTKLASRLVVILSLLAGACATPPSQPSLPPPVNAGALDVAPQLARYTRFEIVSQAASTAGEQRVSGTLDFKPASASFDVSTEAQPAAGRLFVQPEACRDDPGADCQRRFVVSGRIGVLNTTLNCYVPVRNDTAIGYTGQALAGICQDRYGRAFSISIFAQ